MFVVINHGRAGNVCCAASGRRTLKGSSLLARPAINRLTWLALQSWGRKQANKRAATRKQISFSLACSLSVRSAAFGCFSESATCVRNKRQVSAPNTASARDSKKRPIDGRGRQLAELRSHFRRTFACWSQTCECSSSRRGRRQHRGRSALESETIGA